MGGVIAKNHVLFAGLGWVGASAAAYITLTPPFFDGSQPAYFDAPTWVLGGTVFMSCGIAPDIDHPDATVSRTFGPLSRLLSYLVRWLSGGHREGTHTIACALLVGAAAWGLTLLPDPMWYAIAVAVLCAIAGDILDSTYQFPGPSIVWSAGFAAAGYMLADRVVGPGVWFPIAVSGGWIAHIVADSFTVSGTHPFEPISGRRFRIGRLRTASPTEKALTPFMGLALVIVVFLQLNLFADATGGWSGLWEQFR